MPHHFGSVVALTAFPSVLAAQTIAGRVVDSASHKPLAGVTVRPIDALMPEAVFAQANTDTSGAFYLDLAHSGKFRLRFIVFPSTTVNSADFEVGPDDVIQREYVLSVPTSPVYLDYQVDEPVAVKPGTRLNLRYPVELWTKKIEGSALIQYIVDETGRVERESIKVLASTHPEFAQAAIAAVVDVSWLPAQFNGKPVRQLVQQPYNWCIRSCKR